MTGKKNISFQPISSTTVRIMGNTEDIVPKLFKEELISLGLPNKKVISVGEIFKIKSVPYKVNIIKEILIDNELCYDLIVAQKTKTSLFILPMLGGNRTLLFYDTLFINAFIEKEGKEDHIVLLYRKSRKKVFKDFTNLLEQCKGYVSTYSPTSSHIVFTFKVPRKYKADFRRFKQGKYSEFKDTYKLQILDFHRLDIDGTMGQILFKSTERRIQLEKRLDAILPQDSELYSIMNEDEEKFNLNYYF